MDRNRLLDACTAFKLRDNGSLNVLIDEIEAVTQADSLERKKWMTYADTLMEAWREIYIEEADERSWPEPPDSAEPLANSNIIDASTEAHGFLDGRNTRDSIRAQRKVELEGAAKAGDTGPSRNTNRSKTVGRTRDDLADLLVIQTEEGGKVVVYCIACDHRRVQRNPARIYEHAQKCQELIKHWDFLYAKVSAMHVKKSVSQSLEAGQTSSLPPVRTKLRKVQADVQKSETPVSEPDHQATDSDSIMATESDTLDNGMSGLSDSTVLEYFSPVKMTKTRQGTIDLLLFKAVVCCALSFLILDNKHFVELVAGLAPNYLVPDRSTFFNAHFPQEIAVLDKKLREFLSKKTHLTLSFDGWSSRAKDEIYTFHTTTTSRRSFLTDGVIFKGVSVTGKNIAESGIAILQKFGLRLYSCISGDGGPNVRSAKRLIVRVHEWILNAYDPCHNLNLYLKDLGKMFKEDLVVVSGLSNYFSHSNYGTHQLAAERAELKIPHGMKSASETRFSSTYQQALAVQTCMPAIKACLRKGTLDFTTTATKKLREFIEDTPTHFAFMSNLTSMVQLMSSGANAISTLEGQNITCSDVFYAWVCIAWHLEQVLASSYGLSRYRNRVVEAYNHRFNQMMTESSHNMFLVAYVLDPKYFAHGGLELGLRSLKDSETLPYSQFPRVMKQICRSLLLILKGEQARWDIGGKEESDRLVEQYSRYCYGIRPFQRSSSTASEKPLEYWQALAKDSNADQLARIAIKLFSIMPSEICDERTASRLGWFNSMRRSSISPERLIQSARLRDFYENGLTDGNYTHSAHVVLSKVNHSDSPALHLSAPSLMDLLNEDNVSPSEVDKAALEAALFGHPDPYDLAETDRVDEELDKDSHYITRSSVRFDIADYVKLDSSALATLIQPNVGSPSTQSVEAEKSKTSQSSEKKGKPSDWSLADYDY